VGEIVLFKNEGHNVPIVHRIVKVPKSIVNAQFTQDLLTFPPKKKTGAPKAQWHAGYADKRGQQPGVHILKNILYSGFA